MLLCARCDVRVMRLRRGRLVSLCVGGQSRGKAREYATYSAMAERLSHENEIIIIIFF